MEAGTKWALCCTIGCSLMIIWSSLLGVSFDTIEPTECGILYDGSLQRLEQTDLWFEGRYLVGLGKKFIKFPTTLQTIRYGAFDSEYRFGGSLITRSLDGLQMSIDVAFQYQLNIQFNDLFRLYMDFGDDYASQYARVMLQVAADVSSDYLAATFYTNRETIQEAMRKELNSSLVRHYASVPQLQLVNIDFFNVEYNNAILQTHIAEQDVLQALAEQSVASVNADAAVAVAQATAVTLVQIANQTAQSYIAGSLADADILIYGSQKQATSLLALRDELGLNSSQGLLSYNYITALLENDVEKMVISQPYPSPLASIIDAHNY